MDRSVRVLFIVVTVILLSLRCYAADTGVKKAFQRAEQLIGNGNFPEAQSIFDSLYSIKGISRDTIYPRILVEQSTLYLSQGKREESKAAALHAASLINPDGDQIVNTSLWNNLGIIYNRAGNTDSALMCYGKSLEYARKSGDLSWVAAAELNIGMLYYNSKQIEKAEEFFRRAAENASRSDDGYTELISSQLLSSSLLMLGKIEEGGKAIKSAWKLALESEDPMLQLRCIPSLMRYYNEVEKKDSAASFFNMGKDLLGKVPEESPAASGFYSAMIDYYMHGGNYAEALDVIHKFRKSSMAPPERDTYRMLAECLHNLGNDREAYLMMDSARIWTDSLASRKAVEAMSEFNVKYGVLEKEMANRELADRLVRRDRTILLVILVLTLVALAVVILNFKRMKLKRMMRIREKENELLISKRYIEGIEEKRRYIAKELHDGIASDLLALQLSIGSDCDGDSVSRKTERIRESLRMVSHHLIPPDFMDMPLDQVVRHYVAGFDSEDNDRIVEFVSDGDFSHVPIDISLHLYRVIQQEITNIIQHSGAHEIYVVMNGGFDTVSIDIEYKGTLPPQQKERQDGKGMGLRSIDERIKILNGLLERLRENGKSVTRIIVNF